MLKKSVLCNEAHETWDHRCELKKKEQERMGKKKEQTPSKYEFHLAAFSTHALILPA